MTLKLNDSGDLVARWRHVMAADFPSYANRIDPDTGAVIGKLDPGSVYGARAAAWQREYERRTNQTVDGEVSDQDLINLRLVLPPPKPRHMILTFRGMGGVVGQDYTSIIAQACSDVVEEFPVDYIPQIGPAGPQGMGGQSGNDSIAQALNIVEGILRQNARRSFLLDGYSEGAICASHVRNELEPGGRFEQFRPNFVAGVTLGNPCRRFGHTYYLGAIPAGEGISDYSMGPYVDNDWSWCDLAHPGDLYTNVHPLGDCADIIRSFYTYVMDISFANPIQMMIGILPLMMKLVQDALGANSLGGLLGGVAVPADITEHAVVDPLGGLGGLLGGLGGLLGGGTAAGGLGGLTGMLGLLPVLTGLLGHPQVQGATNTVPVPGSGGLSVGPIAAIQAMIAAMSFFFTGTRDHINYHVDEVWPGMTYLGLGIQHVHDWASRTPVKL